MTTVCAGDEKTARASRVSLHSNVEGADRSGSGLESMTRKHSSTATAVVTLAIVTACSNGSDPPATGSSGGTGGTAELGDGGESAAGTANGGSAGVPVRPPRTLGELPVPPASDVPEPSASTQDPSLQVLPWAGFAAAISYTFDDTQPSQVEHWPELKATSVPMTFFANPSNNWQSGFDATWTEVAASGSEIGNHTWSHCHANLSDCTPVGTAEEEIDQATAYIIEHFAVPAVYSFAAPYGDRSWNDYAESRFLAGRGVNSGLVPTTGPTDWYNLPCIPVSEGQTAEDFNASIDNAQSQGRWGIFMFHTILPTSNDWYAGVEIANITDSIDHAESLGDVWVDSMGAIAAYLRGQLLLEAAPLDGDTWTWTLPKHFPAEQVIRVTVDGGTLSQDGSDLPWDPHGYYEVSLDAGTLTWSP